jgi:hypothetical protein
MKRRLIGILFLMHIFVFFHSGGASAAITISDQVSVNPPASVVAAATTSAITGTAFSQAFSASGGVQPITWSVASGALPPGLTLNSGTGEISGTPTAGGIFNFTIQAIDSLAASATKSWIIFANKGLRPGWPQVLQQRVGSGTLPASYSPIVADLNGDGRQELIVADVDTLYVFDANGLVAKTVLPGAVSTPVVADIDNDGLKELVVGVGKYTSSAASVYAFHSDLTPLTGFPAGAVPSYNGGPGVVNSLVVADFDNDGKKEVIAVCLPDDSNDPNYNSYIMTMVDSQGNTRSGWPKIISNGRFGSVDNAPAVADIDNDGQKEIVLTTTDGFVHIFRKDGTEVTSWQFAQNPTEIWPAVLADLHGDGLLEIISKAQTTDTSSNPVSVISVFDATGALLSGWPQEFFGSAPNGLAAADLDNDGRAEIIFASGLFGSKLQAVRSDGSSLPGWPVTLNVSPLIDSNPVVADINGDGQLEVLITIQDYASNGKLAAYDASGSLVPGYPKATTPGNEIRSTPAVGDLDNNGKADIVVKSEDGMLYVWEEDQLSTGIAAAWPMFRHDPEHTGAIAVPPDTTPFPFTFTSQTNVPLSTLVTSNSVTITGINRPAPVTSSGVEYELNNSGLWSGSSGTVVNGNTVRVRLMSSAGYNTAISATLTIGGASGIFSVTTSAADAAPDPFTFTGQTNAAINTLTASNSVTVTGINSPAAINISGGQYELNNSGTWLTAAGTVVNGDTVRVRLTSSASYNTLTSAVLTIGGVSALFNVTTASASIMIPGTSPAYFSSLQAALNAAANGQTIKTQATTFTENLVFSNPVSVVLSGGYDGSFSSVTGVTTIQGSLTIGQGTITIGSGAFVIY